MNKSLTREYGPLIPKVKAHEGGKYSTQTHKDIITKAPIQRVSTPTKSMKPQ